MARRDVKPIHRLIKQAFQYRFLTAGQLSQIGRASSIIGELADDAKNKGDELLADDLARIVAGLDRIIFEREDARQRYLDENRLPDAP